MSALWRTPNSSFPQNKPNAIRRNISGSGLSTGCSNTFVPSVSSCLLQGLARRRTLSRLSPLQGSWAGTCGKQIPLSHLEHCLSLGQKTKPHRLSQITSLPLTVSYSHRDGVDGGAGSGGNHRLAQMLKPGPASWTSRTRARNSTGRRSVLSGLGHLLTTSLPRP